MAFLGEKSDVIYSDRQSNLANGGSITSGWLDMEGVDKVQFSGFGTEVGFTMLIESKADEGGSTQLSTPVTYNDGAFYMFNVICRQRWMKFTWTNDTGSVSADASMEIKQTFGSSDKLSVFPVSVTPSDFSQAALVQSILRGRDAEGNYQNVAVDEIGALLVADFGTEVSRGLYEGYKVTTKFGRSPDIDTIDNNTDIWNAGTAYTGFDCTVAEVLEFFSSNSNDTGAELSSGVATAGDTTSLTDSGATFISDGVLAGDLVINDTAQIHGIIETVDSETKVTVLDMRDGVAQLMTNTAGDAYRIASSASTGAAVMKVNSMLDSEYEDNSEYIILNGTNPVTTTGAYLRQSRARVLLAGSSDTNEGAITGRQSTTTANVTMVMPVESGQTAICCSTVPKGKTWIIKRLHISMARDNGSLGSANARFQIREKGGAWQTKRFPTLTSGLQFAESDIGGIIAFEESDVKWNIQSVSDNSTIVSAEFEYFELDNF